MAEQSESEFVAELKEQTREGLIKWRHSQLAYLEADWGGGKLFVGRNRLQDDITFERKMTLTVDLGQAIKASMGG